jgi:23S rRNA pseudouridine2605 synthase
MPQPARRTPVKKPSKGTAHEYADAARGERLQRVLADAGVGSRRHCEELILAGEVTVNGEVVDGLPAWVDPEKDRIVVEGRVVAEPERRIYLLLNKPPRTLSTLKDEPGADRRTVADLVDHPSAEHLFPVGRLDYDTVGLVLMTNDGELANRLTHPRYGVPKTYLVTVRGKLDEEAVKELERGIFLAERKAGKTVGAVRTAQVEISLVSQDRQNTVLELTLREGRNRQVRRMMAAVGFPVRKLERIGMGPVRLKGVARGAWRELDKDEVWALKRAAAAPGDAVGEADGDERPGTGAKDAPTARSIRKPGESRSSAAARAAKAQPPTVQKPEPRVAKASFKPGAKPGARGAAFGVQDATEASGPRIKRRTMKNAINRATQAGPGKKAEAPTPPEARAAKPTAKPTAGRPGPAKRAGASAKPGPAGKKSGPAREPGPSRGGKPTGKPTAKPTGRSGGKPAGRPSGNPTGKPGHKPGSNPVSRAAPTRPDRPMNKRPRPKP